MTAFVFYKIAFWYTILLIVQKGEESKKFINLGVVLNNKGEVLVIRRVKKEEGEGGSTLEWAFPGGRQRYEEKREDCVKREVCDETGYDVEPIKEISLRVHPQILIMIAYYLCKLKSPDQICEPKEPHEVAEIKWVKKEELQKLFTTDLDPKVAKELGIANKSAQIN
jgi:ADP-ribose pyrophosphatase YjhB (NUDIX family)